jgi:hypothetical protein
MNAHLDESFRSLLTSAVVFCAGFFVAACGGGGDSGAPPSGANPAGPDTGGGTAIAAGDPMPAEASRSVASMLAWARGLGTTDTGLPYRLEGFRPPLDDTTETSPG